MIKTMIAISLVVMSSALGGQLIAGGGAARDADTIVEKSFMTPRLDGRRLDIRYSAARPADPAMTAERFCRSHGFDAVVGYSIQPAAATRLIGDLSSGQGAAGSLRAFYAIRCSTESAPTVTAMQ